MVRLRLNGFGGRFGSLVFGCSAGLLRLRLVGHLKQAIAHGFVCESGSGCLRVLTNLGYYLSFGHLLLGASRILRTLGNQGPQTTTQTTSLLSHRHSFGLPNESVHIASLSSVDESCDIQGVV